MTGRSTIRIWSARRRRASTSSWLNQYCVASGRPVAEPHLFAYLMDRGKAPYARKPDGRLVPAGPFHHAFHFDQALVAKYLRKKDRRHRRASMPRSPASTAMPRPATSTTLLLDEDRSLDVDFVIDCTGFRRALIGKEMGAQWVSYADKLPVNRAMPFWIDLKEGEEINPFTLAWAREAGWMWSIPTRSRYGCGYVYSDRFKTPDEAQAEIETALGHADRAAQRHQDQCRPARPGLDRQLPRRRACLRASSNRSRRPRSTAPSCSCCCSPSSI